MHKQKYIKLRRWIDIEFDIGTCGSLDIPNLTLANPSMSCVRPDTPIRSDGGI